MTDTDTATKTVGLMADPGLAEDVAERVAEDLAARLGEQTKDDWDVENVQEELPLGPDGMWHCQIMDPESWRNTTGITSFISPTWQRFMMGTPCCVERWLNPVAH